jgi:hypothetical protein
MKYVFIVIIIKCVNLMNGEWMQMFSEDYNTNTSCNSCDCGTPALPPQVVIKEYEYFKPPKKFKNGQVVNFHCRPEFYSLLRRTFIGSEISVCSNGKWNKKSGVCGN